MILLGSYANGFAPRDGKPLYPELWRGCVGAWAPCLGPTGFTLRDWSGFGHHASMGGSSVFQLSSGRYAVRTDGVDDTVSVAGLSATSSLTISIWVKIASIPSSRAVITLGKTAIGFGNATTFNWYPDTDTTVTSQTVPSVIGRWVHLAVTQTGTSYVMFLNGLPVKSGTTAVVDTGAGHLNIASLEGTTWFTDMEFDDLRIYNMALQSLLVLGLAKRRGIAHEIAPRRRSRIFTGGFKAYWAARKALIQMAGSN